MGKYKGIIFDLDGTLIDTSDGLFKSIKKAAKNFGYEPPKDSDIDFFMGPPIMKTYRAFYNLTEEDALSLTNEFRKVYKAEFLYNAKPYDNIFDLLEKIISMGIKISAATFKKESFAIDMLNHFGYGKYLISIHGSGTEGVLSKADAVQFSINDLKLDKTECLMVGDTDNDYNAAKDCGIDFLIAGYGYGFKTKESLDSCDHIGVAKSPMDILNFIK